MDGKRIMGRAGAPEPEAECVARDHVNDRLVKLSADGTVFAEITAVDRIRYALVQWRLLHQAA